MNIIKATSKSKQIKMYSKSFLKCQLYNPLMWSFVFILSCMILSPIYRELFFAIGFFISLVMVTCTIISFNSKNISIISTSPVQVRLESLMTNSINNNQYRPKSYVRLLSDDMYNSIISSVMNNDVPVYIDGNYLMYDSVSYTLSDYQLKTILNAVEEVRSKNLLKSYINNTQKQLN